MCSKRDDGKRELQQSLCLSEHAVRRRRRRLHRHHTDFMQVNSYQISVSLPISFSLSHTYSATSLLTLHLRGTYGGIRFNIENCNTAEQINSMKMLLYYFTICRQTAKAHSIKS